MALISVIVPVYKVEKYIKRCVDSILAQSFTDFELILVDDGSPDHCGEICDEYAQIDNRIRVIHQQNGGLSAARNAGLDYVFAHSKSEWITFIDSDDWVHPKYLSLLYDASITEGVELSVCAFTKTNTPEQNDLSVLPPALLVSPENLWLKDRINATVAWGKLYKKHLFKSLRYPEKKLHEDEFVTYQLLFSCDHVAFFPIPLYYYYINQDSIMSRKWTPARMDALNALLGQCSFFRKNHYYKAEHLSAQALLENCTGALNNLLTMYPDENVKIQKTRSLLRHAWRKYKKSLDYSVVGSKKNYMRLAHPVLTKLQKKYKHVLIFIRRLFHA